MLILFIKRWPIGRHPILTLVLGAALLAFAVGAYVVISGHVLCGNNPLHPGATCWRDHRTYADLHGDSVQRALIVGALLGLPAIGLLLVGVGQVRHDRLVRQKLVHQALVRSAPDGVAPLDA